MSDSPFLALGPRVAVRELRPADRAEFTEAVRRSRELHRPWSFLPDNDEAYDRWSAKFDGRGAAGFAVCDRETGRIGAGVAVNNIVRGGFQCGALGYGAFVHFAGEGRMTEGLGLVVRHAFGPMGLHRLEANIQPGNARSRALVQRLGFRLEGLSPDFLYIDGAWRDHERWAVTSEMTADRTA